ncbi:MAG: PilZ domain-containing protein [Anaerolineales bacterium]|nr:PilZ domain-containing protein [Anaerolineales bacterium]
MIEQRKRKRRIFSYYMQVIDSVTQKPIGCLSDISTMGFMLDSAQPLPIGEHYNLRIDDLPNEVADKNFLVFMAQSKWCGADKADPRTQNVGFEIVNITPQDAEIYNHIIERYAV